MHVAWRGKKKRRTKAQRASQPVNCQDERVPGLNATSAKRIDSQPLRWTVLDNMYKFSSTLFLLLPQPVRHHYHQHRLHPPPPPPPPTTITTSYQPPPPPPPPPAAQKQQCRKHWRWTGCGSNWPSAWHVIRQHTQRLTARTLLPPRWRSPRRCRRVCTYTTLRRTARAAAARHGTAQQSAAQHCTATAGKATTHYTAACTVNASHSRKRESRRPVPRFCGVCAYVLCEKKKKKGGVLRERQPTLPSLPC